MFPKVLKTALVIGRRKVEAGKQERQRPVQTAHMPGRSVQRRFWRAIIPMELMHRSSVQYLWCRVRTKTRACGFGTGLARKAAATMGGCLLKLEPMPGRQSLEIMADTAAHGLDPLLIL